LGYLPIKVHKAVDKFVFGRAFPKVHVELDRPAYVLGKKHRMLLHDPISAMLIGRSVAGEKGATVALLHVVVDELCKDKRVKRVFEALG